jgi:hypothetical protein
MVQTGVCDHLQRRLSLEGFAGMTGKFAGWGGRFPSEDDHGGSCVL